MPRPNLLILYTDQQRWDALGLRNPDLHTPHLDRLAAEGVRFDRCFAQNPVCMPSRVSFLTGQYPSTLGLSWMGVPVPEDTVTLPRLLRPYGYRSGNLGKLHFLPHANRDHRVPHPDYGFDELEVSDEPGVYEDAYRAWCRRVAPDQLPHLSVGLPPATAVWRETMGIHDDVPHPSAGGRADNDGPVAFPGRDDVTHSAFVADRTIDFLRRHTGRQPFLAIAGFYSPHAPWTVPQRYLDLYDRERLTLPTFPPEFQRPPQASDERLRAARQGYYAMVSEVDAHVGRILETLDQLGMSDETLVVFTSDHGEWLGEHGWYGKGYPAHDACSRVPLLLRGPNGSLPAGQVIDGLVESVDVLPTLLEAAGIPLPPHLQGRSLLPLCADPSAPARDGALTEHAGWKSLRTDRWRYVVHADGREHLYDLATEWGAYRDVAADPANLPVLAEHRALLVRHWLSTERPRTRTWAY